MYMIWCLLLVPVTGFDFFSSLMFCCHTPSQANCFRLATRNTVGMASCMRLLHPVLGFIWS